MKRNSLILAATLAAIPAAMAQEASPSDARAVIVLEDDAEQVWLTAASATNLEYKSTPQSIDRKRIARSTVQAILFFEPDSFKEGKALYENRDYKAAKEKFAAAKEMFKRLDDLPGNYSTLAGFYEIECCRRMEELETLEQLLRDYVPGPLTREFQKNQVELYAVWDAVRTKSWPRLKNLADELLSQKKWTGSQLAQIYYCKGLALDSLGQKTDALIAFNGAFTADFTASEELTKKSVLNCLRIYKELDEVKLAIELYGTPDEDKNSTGYNLLQEAVALVELWDKALGGGEALPADHKTFLKYKEKQG